MRARQASPLWGYSFHLGSTPDYLILPLPAPQFKALARAERGKPRALAREELPVGRGGTDGGGPSGEVYGGAGRGR